MTNQDIIKEILEDEGSKYTNDPIDNGGPTKYGITLKDLQQFNPSATEEAVKNLTEEQAYKIYYDEYIIKSNYHKIVNDYIRYSMIDFGVNSGIYRATKEMQKILKYNYDNSIEIDGICGDKTINTINNNSSISLFAEINFARKNFLMDIVINKPSQEKFIKGWLNRVNRIIKQLL